MECCKILSFEVSLSKMSIAFYKARGTRMLIYQGRLIVTVPHICKKLTSKGCSIYNTRPDACRFFDGASSITVKDVCLWNKENRK
jgi:Fe-S-cluster containining protein